VDERHPEGREPAGRDGPVSDSRGQRASAAPVDGGGDPGAEVQKAQKIVPVPTLHFSEGSLAGRVVRLDRDVATLGRREDNAYVVPDPRVSRVHAEIRKEASAVIVTDLGSSPAPRSTARTSTAPR
jgi:pSer/pThr/pTyr-binding forkhead associated (FHA) protein